ERRSLPGPAFVCETRPGFVAPGATERVNEVVPFQRRRPYLLRALGVRPAWRPAKLTLRRGEDSLRRRLLLFLLSGIAGMQHSRLEQQRESLRRTLQCALRTSAAPAAD